MPYEEEGGIQSLMPWCKGYLPVRNVTLEGEQTHCT